MADEELEDEEHAPGTHAFFTPRRIAMTMIVIAIIAVLIGMGGQRSGLDKRGDVYSAKQAEAERADRIAGFPDENQTK